MAQPQDYNLEVALYPWRLHPSSDSCPSSRLYPLSLARFLSLVVPVGAPPAVRISAITPPFSLRVSDATRNNWPTVGPLQTPGAQSCAPVVPGRLPPRPAGEANHRK